MNTNSMYCADAKNCSCEMYNKCCGNVNASGCGNPMYNVFSWNSPRKCCYRPELCAIDILHYYLTKGEAAEIYVNNREFLDFLKEVKNVYETKERVFEILQDLLDKIDSVTASCEWDDIKDKPNFATVATSGDYDDLNNKPEFKTINGEPILGNGDIEVVVDVDDHIDGDSENPVQNKVITAEVETIKGGSDKSIAALDAQDEVLGQRVDSLESAVGTGGSVDTRILSAVSAEADARQAGDGQLLSLYEALTQSDIVVVADHTEVSSPTTNTIYREQGDTSYSDWMYYNGNWYKMAEYDNAIDKEPTPYSHNLVESGGVAKAIKETNDIVDDSVHDFAITDETGYNIATFDEGHIKTKNFDSSQLKESSVSVADDSKYDFSIADEFDDAVVVFENGEIRTQKFRSVETPSLENSYSSDYAVSDEQGNIIMKLSGGHIKTKNFDSSSIQSPIPEYYKSEFSRVVSKYYGYAEAGRIGYIFMTDLHFSPNTPDNTQSLLNQIECAVKIANESQVDFIAFGGDIIDGTDNKSFIYQCMLSINEILARCSKPIVWITGNHDDNSYSASQVSEKSLARNVFVDVANVVDPVFGSSDKEDCYYYFELPKKNVRVICLDFIDFPSNKKGRSWWGFSQTQVEWFCSEALNTNKNIIILSHGQLVDKMYEFYNLGDEGGYTTDIKNAIIAFNNKSSITLYGVTYDFSNRQGKIILSQHGHWHADMELSIGNMPAILTGCAKHQLPNLAYQPVSGKEDTYIIPDQATAVEVHANGYGYEFVYSSNRDYGTVNEALFDVVSVNNDAVHCIRFGAGFDRDVNLV